MAKKIIKELITEEILNTSKSYTDSSIALVSAGNIYTGTTATTPVSTGTVIYNISSAGTYTNFLDNTSTPIIVSSIDLEQGLVQLRGLNNVFTKVITPINLKSYSTKENVYKVRDSISVQSILNITKVDNMFLAFDTGLPTSSTLREYTFISATENDNIQFSGWGGGVTTALAVYYDASNNYLGYEQQGTGVDIQYVKYRFNPLPLTAKIGITNKKSAGTMTVYKNTEIAFTTELNNIKLDIDSAEDRITIVEDTIKEKITPSYVVSQDFFYAYNTGILTSSTLREYTSVNVADTDIILVTATTIGSPTALAVYFNSSNVYIGYEERGIDAVNTNYVNYKLNIPTGTAKIGITNFKGGNTLSIKKLIPLDYTEKFNNIDEEITEIKDSLKELIPYTFTKITDKYLNYSTGIEASSTLREYTFISATVSDRVIVSGWVSGSLTALAIYYDSSDNYLGFEHRGIDSVNTQYNNVRLNIPTGTAKIGITNMKLLGDLEIFHLEGIDLNSKFEFINNNFQEKKDFSTKTFVIFGDSITDGRVNGQTYCWVDTLKEKLNIPTENLFNIAIPGARYSFGSGTDPNETDPTFTNNLNNTGHAQINKWELDFPEAPDYFFIALGTNDIEQIYPIGTEEDAFAQSLTSTSYLTMSNACRKMIQRLQTSYPTSKIIVLTPIQGITNYRNFTSISNVGTHIKNICNRLGVIYIDCLSALTNQYEIYGSNGRFLLDGTHPNPTGGLAHGIHVVTEFLNRVKY